MNVLAVDDDAVAALLIEAVLKSLGHDVTLASGGENALVAIGTRAIRLVVSDWQMKGGDGLDLCRRVRATGGDYVYFILLTQREPSEENERLAMEAGVDDFLTKPVNARELRMRLHVAERILGYTKQVQQLESFLPICSYCKKVRDDRDYWQQIEGYIESRTKTQFSHGICPECYRQIMSGSVGRSRIEGTDSAGVPS